MYSPSTEPEAIYEDIQDYSQAATSTRGQRADNRAYNNLRPQDKGLQSVYESTYLEPQPADNGTYLELLPENTQEDDHPYTGVE